MKKVMFFFIMMGLLIILSTKQSYACSCADFDVDEYLNQDNRVLIYGTVHKKLSGRRVIFKVQENYSKNVVNQYITIYTTTTVGASCGVNFNDYERKELLIRGNLDEGDTVMKVGLCSIKHIQSGNINRITLDDERYETITLTELNNHVSQTYEGQDYGEINENN
ncbi:hypothetical protein [Haloplasma contractile]|uniref:Tissue inhibitor of metalloproteinase n=1 Tax=Haloplasma contractile SSD-17B TaxID=1033810 RepID=F7PU52_9MOLU|nr:hypothetical protein [Haloplasma contractile]ERJ11770.1 hypothetical protein HLPCO_002253 [Haloplasma contractile SSD-17B]